MPVNNSPTEIQPNTTDTTTETVPEAMRLPQRHSGMRTFEELYKVIEGYVVSLEDEGTF